MKRHRLLKSFFALGLFAVIVYLSQTQLVPNLWGLLTEKNYFIPKESNVFVFKALAMNGGSGDWWLTGEDKHYRYVLNLEGDTPQYFKYPKK